MTAKPQVIDGSKMAAALRRRVAEDVARLEAEEGVVPALAVILVGDDPASGIYVKRKLAACAKARIRSIELRAAAEIGQRRLLELIDELNSDPSVNGILVQLPLPRGIDPAAVLDRIDPMKDVDGFHPVNVGRLSTATDGLVPCTPLGCTMLLESVIQDFRGLHAVVIGKSNIVGKPIALLLLDRECTVTVTHIYTRDLPGLVREADIVVSAAGSPGLVKGDWVKPGAVVIDVGINRVMGPDGEAQIVGDCDRSNMDHVAAITPVPGGVGPMTVACLLANTVRAAKRQLACGRQGVSGELW
jgi:methylenetetrahydrofolate dehydrogenase (NADP+)/methenyltetrahydrofolate cyclohydrolase